MNCESIQSQITLYLYGELGSDETEALEAHIESCGECARQLEESRTFFATMNERPMAKVSHGLMSDCRQDLMREVYHIEPEPVGLWHRFTAWFSGNQNTWRPALAVASLAMAFVIGRGTGPETPGTFGGSAEPPTIGQPVSFESEPMLTGIESVAREGSGGQVEIVIEEVSRRTIKGNASDPQIQALLLSTVRSAPNEGARLESVDILTERADNSEVRQMLLDSMLNDRNPGVRLKALEALSPHQDEPEVSRALIEVLRGDPNAGMRTSAINLLTEEPDRRLVGVLQELVETTDHDYVRLRSKRALQDLNASVDRF